MIAIATEMASKMNRNESAYAGHLELLRRAGEIRRWDYEPEKLRLADATFLTPDFRVIANDGAVEFHDTKGSKGAEKFHVEEDAWVKYKIAAELHPYRFFVAWRHKGHWHTRRVGREDA